MITAPDLAQFPSEIDELNARRDFMIRRGYRFCDMAACNCNSWHQGHAENNVYAIDHMLRELDAIKMGESVSDAIKRVLSEAGYSED